MVYGSARRNAQCASPLDASTEDDPPSTIRNSTRRFLGVFVRGGRVGHDGSVRPKASRFKPLRGDATSAGKELHHRFGTILGKAQVVFTTPARVGVALDEDVFDLGGAH